MSTQLIIESMENLVKLHSTLLEMANEKTEFIKKGDISHLRSILQKESSSLKQLERVEQERVRLVHYFIQGKGLVTENVTLSTILPYVNEEDRKQLTDLQNELLQIIRHLKETNELNQQMIQDSLRFVNLSLDLLQPEQDSGNYNRPDKDEDEAYGRSLFDSKA